MHGLPVDTDAGPPLGLPLRFFLTGFGFLLAATIVGVVAAAGVRPGFVSAAHAHLLLAGWACLTILGAMAQFVPTWSGGRLRWRRLVELALPLVAVGIAGLAGALLLSATAVLPVFGVLAALGFWVFVAAMARTLHDVRPLDVTEVHFALALVALALVPALGLLLAEDLARGLLAALGLGHAAVLGAHATLAVFGVVVTTILGALRQLGTMFTQVEPTRVDRALLRVQSGSVPVGVGLLVLGRFLTLPSLTAVGVGLVGVGLVAFAVVLGHLLLASVVDTTPMHPRYAVVALAMVGWVALGVPAIVTSGDAAGLFGGPAARAVLFLGVVGFTLLGTLYHVVPFLIWMDRYADRVGLEPVPAIEDLYDRRVARLDLALTGLGLLTVTVAALLDAATVGLLGTVAFFAGAALAVGNLVVVVVRHAYRAPPEGQGAVAPGE